MVTLFVGLLVVVAGAAGFGAALFGRRPVPQPATVTTGPRPAVREPEARPSGPRRRAAAGPATASETLPGDVLSVGRLRALLQREPSADHQPGGDVTLSTATRVRSALLLALVVFGLAAIIGVVVSLILVGAVTVLT